MNPFLQVFCENLAFSYKLADEFSMLLQFSVSNFKSIRHRQTLNLAASNYDKSLPGNASKPNEPASSKSKRWLHGAAIYGANASGKTTVIKALEALQSLVQNSAKKTDPKEPIEEFQPFALETEGETQPTAFAIVFVSNGTRYEYRVAGTRQRLLHESLRTFPGPRRNKLWYARNWDESTNAYCWSQDTNSGYSRDPKREEFTLPNQLFLSRAISLGDTQLEACFRWFGSELITLQFNERALDVYNNLTARLMLDSPELASKILEILKLADLGITDAEVKEPLIDDDLQSTLARLYPDHSEALKMFSYQVKYRIQLSHRGVGGQSLPLPWEDESAGTARLFNLAGFLVAILTIGRTVCIDELETSLHPLMAQAIVKLFFSTKDNPKGAQIIFTTHNPLLLDQTLMRRDQIWFTDKDEEGATHLYPLTDYQPRAEESLVRGYLSGRYGAIPFIPCGLLGSDDCASKGEVDE